MSDGRADTGLSDDHGAPHATRPDGLHLWVVVPAWNEECGIGATMAALADQRDRDFTLVVVDNGSTDGTAAVERACAAAGLAVR